MPKALAIELTEADANVVQLDVSKKTGVQLELAFRVGFEDIPKDDNAPVEQARRLKEALRQHRATTALSSLVVPKQSTTVRKVRLPSADPAEIESMAAFEAEKIIPFNVERHIIAYQTLGGDGIEGTDVLLAAIDGIVMDQWYSVVKGAGVDPTVADVSSLALADGLLDRLDEAEGQKSFASVHIGWTHTDLVLYDRGEIVTTRSVKHGVRDLLQNLARATHSEEPLPLSVATQLDLLHPERLAESLAPEEATPSPVAEGEEEGETIEIVRQSPAPAIVKAARTWLGKLVTNVQRTYEFAAREFDFRPCQQIYLSGEGALVGHLDQALQQQLHLPVALFDPVRDLPRTPKAQIEEDLIPAFSVAYGAALRLARTEGEGLLSLLPPEVLARRELSELRMHFAATGVLALLAAAMIVLYINSNASHREEKHERYRSFTSEMSSIVREFDDMRDRMRIIRDIRSEQAGALHILEQISRYPELESVTNDGNITLRDFEFTIGDSVRLSGYGLTVENINDFVLYLQDMENDYGEKIFSQVPPPTTNPTTLPRRDRSIYQFDIEAIIASGME